MIIFQKIKFQCRWVLLIMIGVSVNLPAQINHQMAFDTYRVDDGLIANWIHSLAQDADGNMWIGTNEGLSRFDGYSFKNYLNNPLDSTSVRGDLIIALSADTRGNLWILTENGINLYDPIYDNFLRVDALDALISKNTNTKWTETRALFSTSDGSIYLGLKEGLINFDLQQNKGHFYKADSTQTGHLPYGFISDLAEDSKGRIFVATAENGIHLFDPSSGVFTPLWDIATLPADADTIHIDKICITKDDVLWAGTSFDQMGISFFNNQLATDSVSALLWNYDLKTNKSYHFNHLPIASGFDLFTVSDIVETTDGTIWISRTSGRRPNLDRYFPETKSFQNYGHVAFDPTSLAWNFISVMTVDRNGDIWVGTSRGLSRSNSYKGQINRFSRVPGEPFHLENLFYTPMEIATDQFILVNDAQQKATRWNRITGESEIILFTDLQNVLSQDTVTKSMWARNVKNGIDRYNYQQQKTHSYKNNKASADWLVYQANPVSEDTLLLTTSEGFWFLDLLTEQFSRLLLKSGETDMNDLNFLRSTDISDGIFYSFKETIASNDLTPTTDSQINIYKIDLRNQTVLKHYQHTLSRGKIILGRSFEFFMDSKGKLWTCARNMLVCLDPKSGEFTEYEGDAAYEGKNVIAAIEDREGYIWFNSEEHISRLNPETGDIQSIHKSDGLATFRMNFRSSAMSRRGELIFAGVGGVTYFDPKSFKFSSEIPNIVLSSFEVGKKKMDYRPKNTAGLQIPWADNSINIEYKSITFRNAKLTTYSYILEGWQNEWQDAGLRRFVQFTNLPPGTYTFKVKATNSNGFESEETAEVSFTILPPWWRTWWAYLIYTLATIFLFIGIVAWLRKREKLRERERNRQRELAQAKEIEKAYHNLEIAHEQLKAAQEQLVQQEKLASLGQLTAGIAHEIKNPLNFVNNFSELNIEMVDEAVAELEHIPADKADPIRVLLSDVRANLQKILQHGTRADGIVKSMLQHSRGGSGIKEPTDLNALLSEFVNLAFHGMRAGKNPINVKLDFELDPNLGQVDLIGEDFSRVVLNLVNNAFDAMRDKAKTNPDYKAVLTTSSKREGNLITVSIGDNGPGIPKEIQDKILQPFFTTKKGTEGTGLGLSITNDIIKAHGGTLQINSVINVKTIFTIIIAKTNNISA